MVNYGSSANSFVVSGSRIKPLRKPKSIAPIKQPCLKLLSVFVLFDKYFRNKLVLLDVNPDISVLRVNALPVGFFLLLSLKIRIEIWRRSLSI